MCVCVDKWARMSHLGGHEVTTGPGPAVVRCGALAPLMGGWRAGVVVSVSIDTAPWQQCHTCVTGQLKAEFVAGGCLFFGIAVLSVYCYSDKHQCTYVHLWGRGKHVCVVVWLSCCCLVVIVCGFPSSQVGLLSFTSSHPPVKAL